MSDLNRVTLSGRITKDCELRYTPSGTAVTDLSVCSNRYRKAKSSGETNEEPCFVDCVVWGSMAEGLAKFLKKGRYVVLDGRLQLDKWETTEGVKRSKLRLIVENLTLTPGGGGAENQTEDTAEDSEAVEDPAAEYADSPF
jgi:single-strand DNA-binding protein